MSVPPRRGAPAYPKHLRKHEEGFKEAWWIVLLVICALYSHTTCVTMTEEGRVQAQAKDCSVGANMQQRIATFGKRFFCISMVQLHDMHATPPGWPSCMANREDTARRSLHQG
eukprot:1270938-Amphidinium_carterae.1